MDASPLYAAIDSRTEALRQLVGQTQGECCNQGQPNYLKSGFDNDWQFNLYQSETGYSP